jgi:hypothetical protein
MCRISAARSDRLLGLRISAYGFPLRELIAQVSSKCLM